MRRKALLVLACFVAAVGFTMAPFSYVNIGRIASFWNTVQAYDSVAGGQPGGKVVTYLCDSTTGQNLEVGDVVFIKRNNMVGKSATITSYNTIAGVVVGGQKTNMQAAQAITNYNSNSGVGDTACVATPATFQNNKVLVLTDGRTWVKVDAAAGIAPGSLLWPSTTTAGFVKAMPAQPDSFYRNVGRLVDTGIVSTAVPANVHIH